MNRRDIFRTAASLAMFSRGSALLAASDFWNRKPASEWSAQEVEQLNSRSPWAKEVNAEFIDDADYTSGGAAGPVVGRNGTIAAPGSAAQSPQVEIGHNVRDPSAGARRREPVTVRWESAQPIRDAGGIPLAADFKDRYVISVSSLPLGIMEKPRRGGRGEAQTADNSLAARQRRMIDALSGAATLQAKALEPAQAGVVQAAPRTPGTYLFGFSRELLSFDAGTREILFTLDTALMAVKARFDPKAMLYHGHLAT